MLATFKSPSCRGGRAARLQHAGCRVQLKVACSKENAVRELEEFQRTLSHKLRDVKMSSQAASAVSVTAPEKTQTAQTAPGELHVLTQDTFYPYLEQAGDTLVVVDFYTDWCGPCKVIYPKLVELNQKYDNVLFAKFNCNKQNKDLGIKLGVKVAPTFHFYRKSQKVAEMTGAKVDKLIELIEANLA